MNNSQRAWELAMVLIANGKIPFDPGNPGGSVKILARHLEALETALHGESILTDKALAPTLGHERVQRLGGRRPVLVSAD